MRVQTSHGRAVALAAAADAHGRARGAPRSAAPRAEERRETEEVARMQQQRHAQHEAQAAGRSTRRRGTGCASWGRWWWAVSPRPCSS